MRVLFAVFSLIVACHAYDAVLFSNQREIGGISTEQLVKGATPEEPIVFIVNPDFTLGQFSVKANAYSAEPTTDYLAKSVKNSNFHESQYFPHQIQASTAQVVTSADQYKAGSALYIIAGEEWTSMEQLAEQLISKIDNSIGVITSTDAVSHEKTNRVKRVATDEMDGANSDSTDGPQATGAYAFPLILPPYNVSGLKVEPTADMTCLFYLEGINIVVQQKNDKVFNYASVHIPGNNMTWAYADKDADCQTGGSIGNFTFRLRMTLTQDVNSKVGNNVAFSMKSGDLIDVSLTITGDLFGYWSLTGATMNNAKITAGTFKGGLSKGQSIDKSATQYSKINSVAGWALACSQSQAVFFPTDEPTIQIGFSLANTQIQTFNIQNNKTWIANPHFTLQTEDCTGTFSAGSWMGIVSALVLIAGLMFGYVMLQSVQTMDRFDDPKQKQIVINVRE